MGTLTNSALATQALLCLLNLDLRGQACECAQVCVHTHLGDQCSVVGEVLCIVQVFQIMNNTYLDSVDRTGYSWLCLNTETLCDY